MIFIDEFKFSSHTSKHYGWAPKGKSEYYTLSPWSFQVTFILAFSVKNIHGVIATTETFNSEKNYILFGGSQKVCKRRICDYLR